MASRRQSTRCNCASCDTCVQASRRAMDWVIAWLADYDNQQRLMTWVPQSHTPVGSVLREEDIVRGGFHAFPPHAQQLVYRELEAWRIRYPMISLSYAIQTTSLASLSDFSAQPLQRRQSPPVAEPFPLHYLYQSSPPRQPSLAATITSKTRPSLATSTTTNNGPKRRWYHRSNKTHQPNRATTTPVRTPGRPSRSHSRQTKTPNTQTRGFPHTRPPSANRNAIGYLQSPIAMDAYPTHGPSTSGSTSAAQFHGHTASAATPAAQYNGYSASATIPSAKPLSALAPAFEPSAQRHQGSAALVGSTAVHAHDNNTSLPRVSTTDGTSTLLPPRANSSSTSSVGTANGTSVLPAVIDNSNLALPSTTTSGATLTGATTTGDTIRRPLIVHGTKFEGQTPYWITMNANRNR